MRTYNRRKLAKKIIVMLFSLLGLILLLAVTGAMDRSAHFADENLEAAVRSSLGREDRPLFRSDLLTITHLDLSGAGITDLEGIDQLRRLAYLNLENNDLTVLPDLSRLSMLKELNLRDNGLTNIDPNSLPRSLNLLNLRGNKLETAVALEHLIDLEKLNLRDNSLTGLEPLAGLTGLRYLNLRGNSSLGDISPLGSLANLEELVLSELPLEGAIEPLAGLTNLYRLDLRSTGLTDVAPIVLLMSAGALQDRPEEGIKAEVLLDGNPGAEFSPLSPYWASVSTRAPLAVPSLPPEERTIYISEFMSANSTAIAAGDGEYYDWIEIHNAGSVSFDLTGHYLSDSEDDPLRWRFPEAEIEPGGYLLIWASGLADRAPAGELHTGFRIDREGEPLILTAPDGETCLDYVGSTPVPRDISMGRIPEDPGRWLLFANPTPGGTNPGDGYRGMLKPPGFSHPGGFYDEQFQLFLTASAGATIYYTLDGSEPDPENLDGSTYSYKTAYPRLPGNPIGSLHSRSYLTRLYEGPIAIVDRTGDPDPLHLINTAATTGVHRPPEPVLRGTVVRARAYRDGYLPSETVTYSYFIGAGEIAALDVPLVALTVPEKYFFDYHSGIYVPGSLFDRWRATNPNRPNIYGHAANYRQRGQSWEREGNLEFYDPAGTLLLNQACGFRLHGGSSRSFAQKNLRVYARAVYGESEFRLPLLEDKETDTFKRFLLRNSGDDFGFTMFRDVLMQGLVEDLNIDRQHSRAALVFINGEYWGVQNIRDRIDRYYLHYEYGVDPDNVDLITLSGRVKEGDGEHYQSMLSYLRSSDIGDESVLAALGEMMDLQNFTDYQIANIYFANTDWPHNNIDCWRLRTESYISDAPVGHDGRWRWILYDTDFGFGWPGGAGSSEHNTLALATGSSADSAIILNTLLRNEQFRNSFINAFAGYLNTAFHPDTVIASIDRLEAEYAPLMPDHINRYGLPGSVEIWQANIEALRRFALERPDHVRRHISSRFGLSGTYTLNLDKGTEGGGTITVNGIDPWAFPSSNPVDMPAWSGTYFQGIPIAVEAIPDPGYMFAGWANLDNGEPRLDLEPNSDLKLTAIFAAAEN